MNDDRLISLNAAIDAFLAELTKRERKNFLHTWSTVEVKYFVADMLEKLPSAQPTCTNTVQVDDCISREAAIEAMRKAKDKSEAHRMLVQLPSAQPGWIPCSEKAVEIPCLVCDKFGQIFIPTGGIVQIGDDFYDGANFDFGSPEEFLKGKKVGHGMRLLPTKIIAWMPLPTPYREGGQE